MLGVVKQQNAQRVYSGRASAYGVQQQCMNRPSAHVCCTTANSVQFAFYSDQRQQLLSRMPTAQGLKPHSNDSRLTAKIGHTPRELAFYACSCQYRPTGVAIQRRLCDAPTTERKQYCFGFRRAFFAENPVAIIVWSNQGL